MDQFLAYLRGLNFFTTPQLEEIVSLTERTHVNKGEFLVRESQRCTAVAFVEKGVFRSFYTHADGIDMTYCFRFPLDFVGAYSSFITGGPSIESIQAITAAEVLLIKKQDIAQSLATTLAGTRFLRYIAEQQFLELENRVFGLQRLSAKERYQELVNKHPHYIQHIPLQYIASYLGISARHLSRVRREIVF
ncbi:Crp/Fnr family transcriptional regulator [Sphingobacterium paludis]|uniref:CRP-like cAMP-binding protein n=1 Tax=Sphingobacterium paludis TaxID=1476465 RepID=A0A4R7CYS1_9SPHI|nr:Crp/Fnr family transcriptional regulator [Sphingobacterium paludis]TDS12294.1 CRP-like cAMP-binding protein [Sphingobacterium paludis]